MTCTRYDKNAKRVCRGKVRPSGRWVAGNVCEVCGAYQRDSARPWSRSGEQPTTVGEACNGCVGGHMGRDGDWLACSARCGVRQVWSESAPE